MEKPPLRLLIVDDSAYNRKLVSDAFAGSSDVVVCGKAADGEEALRLAALHKPDVITLDLEMPRMDGFTFLRLLMARQPTPVIVVSSYAQKENVFKALELGAIDFVNKPEARGGSEVAAAELKEQLVQKVAMSRGLRPSRLLRAARTPMPSGFLSPEDADPHASGGAVPGVVGPPKWIVAIASSTGGPTALLEIFAKLPPTSPAAVVIAQHMPDKFTRTFAERLDRRGAFATAEAQGGERVAAATAYVCPGRQSMEVAYAGSELQVRVVPRRPDDRYTPSADRLLRAVAATCGARSVGVILTGMGDDGLEGARAIRAAGGLVIAESPESAVVYGMPGAVAREGLAHRILPLAAIATALAELS